MAIPLTIARRHFLSHHKFGYISFIGIVAICGLAIGVAALILTIAILNGFENEIKTKLLGFDAHIRLRLVYPGAIDSTMIVQQTLDRIPEIKSYVPYVHGGAMIRHAQETEGIIVEGLREEDLKRTLQVERFLQRGRPQLSLVDNRKGILLGSKLAQQLGVGLQDELYLFTFRRSGLFRQPRFLRFTVTGIYSSGIAEYDDIFVYIDLTAAQQLFDLGTSFTGYQIILKDPAMIDPVTERINAELGYPHNALSWNDLHANLFEWLRVQRFPIVLIFGLIAIVALFNIVSSLMMIVIEKTRDIGILKSLGLPNRDIARIFLYEGLIIGIVGALLGSLLALGLGWLQHKYQLIALPAEVYFMNSLPVMLRLGDFLVIGLLGVLSAALATIYPARKAAHLSPSEAIQYE